MLENPKRQAAIAKCSIVLKRIAGAKITFRNLPAPQSESSDKIFLMSV
ncbi:MAG: hypothetical protein ACR2N3_14575 [Pyrinomonadaceae bacterium]